MVPTDQTTKGKPPIKKAVKLPPKPYRKPRLEKLGDLRTLTLGVSGAPQDFSGGQLNQQTPP